MLINKLNQGFINQDVSEYSDTPTRERSIVPKPEPSELELKELVRRAQAFDQAAIDELYDRFRGMIINLINTESIQKALGEDAENTAWMYFYDVIHKIDTTHSNKNIAGYLKKYVNCELIQKVKEITQPWNVDSINEYEEKGYPVADKNNDIVSYLENSILKENIAKLPIDTRTLLRKYYFEGYSEEDCAKLIGKTYTATRVIKHRALSKLREIISPNDYAYN